MESGTSSSSESLTSDLSYILECSLQAGDIAVCVKDSAKKVLMQNDSCRRICGVRLGETCEQGCMDLHAKDHSRQWNNWGSHVYRNSVVQGNSFDITLLCTAGHIVTFLQPLKDKYEKALAYYRDKGLTKRELEVISLAIRGASNAEICDQLSISRSTLRTHLNKVYAKLRESGDMPEFIPATRL